MIAKLLKLSMLVLILVPAAILKGQAQNALPLFTAKNAVFLELGGNGGYYSLNYERMFYQNGLFKSAARVGLTTFPVKIAGFAEQENTYWNFGMPLELVGLIGRTNHHLELGVGYTPFLFVKSKINEYTLLDEYDGYRLNSSIFFRTGYRYQKPDGGFYFRAGFTPFLDFDPRRIKKYSLMAGLSFGKSF